MTPEGHNDLFPAIQAVLKEATEPLDCHQLYEREDIRRLAPTVNRVSDYLGVLFRKGQVTRVATNSANSRARWAYAWRNKPLPDWRGPEPTEFRPKAVLDRPDLYIAENGEFISIELPGFSITIKAKKKKE